jgi:hypothetical protein
MSPPDHQNQRQIEIHERQMKREMFDDQINVDLGRSKEDINYDRY